jgi:ribosomal protein L11 methyltransferase
VKWVEVSLPASAEAAEAIADVLAGFAPNGTSISGELGQAEALLTVQAFLPAEAATDEVRQRIREAIWHLSQIVALPEPSFRLLEEEDWAESWKVNFRPLSIGRQLLVLPPWLEVSDSTRLPLVLDPGMAFGTGAHPSTRRCLEALEERIQPRDLVVDVGCGSGILSVAAVLLGAGHVLACDIDEDAIAATLRGAEINGVASKIEVFQGSWMDAAARLADGRPADIVVANILAPVLSKMLGEGLAEIVGPGRWLILAGILEEQRQAVDDAARAAGLTMEAEARDGIWVTLTFRRTPELHASDG